MDKNGYMKNLIRGQMVKLNPPKEKNTWQEIANRHYKVTLNKSLKKNNLRNLFKGPFMTFG